MGKCPHAGDEICQVTSLVHISWEVDVLTSKLSKHTKQGALRFHLKRSNHHLLLLLYETHRNLACNHRLTTTVAASVQSYLTCSKLKPCMSFRPRHGLRYVRNWVGNLSFDVIQKLARALNLLGHVIGLEVFLKVNLVWFDDTNTTSLVKFLRSFVYVRHLHISLPLQFAVGITSFALYRSRSTSCLGSCRRHRWQLPMPQTR